MRTAQQQAQLNLNERQSIWEKEMRDRDFLYKRLDMSLGKLQNGMDHLTKLDMNIPDQFRMAQKLGDNLTK
jgi:hypothetical protein